MDIFHFGQTSSASVSNAATPSSVDQLHQHLAELLTNSSSSARGPASQHHADDGNHAKSPSPPSMSDAGPSAEYQRLAESTRWLHSPPLAPASRQQHQPSLLGSGGNTPLVANTTTSGGVRNSPKLSAAAADQLAIYTQLLQAHAQAQAQALSTPSQQPSPKNGQNQAKPKPPLHHQFDGLVRVPSGGLTEPISASASCCSASGSLSSAPPSSTFLLAPLLNTTPGGINATNTNCSQPAASVSTGTTGKSKSRRVRGSILYSPSHDSTKYKTQLCRNLFRTGVCQFGNKCAFAHSANEIRLGAAPETPPTTSADPPMANQSAAPGLHHHNSNGNFHNPFATRSLPNTPVGYQSDLTLDRDFNAIPRPVTDFVSGEHGPHFGVGVPTPTLQSATTASIPQMGLVPPPVEPTAPRLTTEGQISGLEPNRNQPQPPVVEVSDTLLEIVEQMAHKIAHLENEMTTLKQLLTLLLSSALNQDSQ